MNKTTTADLTPVEQKTLGIAKYADLVPGAPGVERLVALGLLHPTPSGRYSLEAPKVSEPVETTSEEPNGFDEVNAAIEAMKTPTERVDPAEVDSLQASWSKTAVKRTRRRYGKGRDFINEWTRSLGRDPKLKKHAGVKFAAAILATYADEKTGTVALGMAEWAEATGTAKTNIVGVRDKLIDLVWLKPTGRKIGQKNVFDLTVPEM
jgi:hypothetical protein